MTQEKDIYWDGLLEICCMYRDKKEVVRPMIKTSKVVVSILTEVYGYLVRQKEIDPTDSTDRQEISHYLLNII